VITQKNYSEKMWISKNNELTNDFDKALKFDDWCEARLKAISLEMNNLVVISNFSLLSEDRAKSQIKAC
jgi:hypothetical protein